MSKDKRFRASRAADVAADPKLAKGERKCDDKTSNWYDNPICCVVADSPVSLDAVKRYFGVAEQKYKEQVSKYQASLNMTATDREWFIEVTKKGTLKDKLAAYAMAVQEGPFYSLEHLSTVLSLTSSSNRHEGLAVSEGFTDILVGNGFLPRNRKLYYLHQRPLSDEKGDVNDKDLLLWYFEDRIKTIYFSFLKVIEKLLQDTIEYTRERSTRFLFDLIMACPIEQQANSLALLANKLGDPSKKLASRIIFYLEEICKAHHHHSSVALSTVQCVKEIVARPKVSERAQYYGLTFLSQLYLSRKDSTVSSSLLSIYTAFFKNVVVPELMQLNRKKGKGKKVARTEEKDTEPSRITKAVLMGINRVLPFAADSEACKKIVGEFVEPLIKLSKMANINVSILALSIFYQLYKITNNPLHRNLMFNQLCQLCGDWMRLAKFSNSFPALFHLLDKLLDDESHNDGKMEKLMKKVINSSVHLNTQFTLLSLQWTDRAFTKLPRLKALILMPPESVDEVLEASLFEFVALVNHYDPLISECASALVKSQPFPVIKNVDSESSISSFISDLESLHSTTHSSKAIITAIEGRRLSLKPKNPKKQKLNNEPIDDDSIASSEDISEDYDFDDEEFHDDISDESDDGSIDEDETENIFESADEAELE